MATIDNAHPAAPDAFLNPIIPDDCFRRHNFNKEKVKR
jgi:hypothetical protein